MWCEGTRKNNNKLYIIFVKVKKEQEREPIHYLDVKIGLWVSIDTKSSL